MPLYQRFVRDVLTPLVLWRRGETAQLASSASSSGRSSFRRTSFADLQLARLRPLLVHAYDHCPFYRHRFDAGRVRAGEPAPPGRPAGPAAAGEARHPGARRRHGRARTGPRADLIRNQTGGSTGTPVPFFLSGDRKCSRAAATLRHNRWAGWEVGDRAAVIWGAPRDRPADAGGRGCAAPCFASRSGSTPAA